MRWQDDWTGLLQHVAGVHEWSLGACLHGKLSNERQDARKELFDFESPCHQKLSSIVMGKRFMASLKMYTKCRWAVLSPFPLAFILFGHLLLYCLWVRFCSFTEQCYFLGGELQWPLEYVHAQENTIAVSIIYLIIQQHAVPLHVLRWDNGILVHVPSFDDQFNFPFYDKTHKWGLLFFYFIALHFDL